MRATLALDLPITMMTLVSVQWVTEKARLNEQFPSEGTMGQKFASTIKNMFVLYEFYGINVMIYRWIFYCLQNFIAPYGVELCLNSKNFI